MPRTDYRLPGIYNASPITLTDGRGSSLAVDINGKLLTTSTISGTVAATQSGTWTVQPGNTANTTPWLVQQSFSNTNITTATTTTVKSGAGVLHQVTVNTKGTIASTITIYDNTAGSGTKIGTIDSLNLAGAFAYDVGFTTGLTLVTTGTVAPDISVVYR